MSPLYDGSYLTNAVYVLAHNNDSEVSNDPPLISLPIPSQHSGNSNEVKDEDIVLSSSNEADNVQSTPSLIGDIATSHGHHDNEQVGPPLSSSSLGSQPFKGDADDTLTVQVVSFDAEQQHDDNFKTFPTHENGENGIAIRGIQRQYGDKDSWPTADTHELLEKTEHPFIMTSAIIAHPSTQGTHSSTEVLPITTAKLYSDDTNELKNLKEGTDMNSASEIPLVSSAPKRRGRPKGSKNKRLSLLSTTSLDELTTLRRRVSDSTLLATSKTTKRPRRSLEALFFELCGPQLLIPPSHMTAAGSGSLSPRLGQRMPRNKFFYDPHPPQSLAQLPLIRPACDSPLSPLNVRHAYDASSPWGAPSESVQQQLKYNSSHAKPLSHSDSPPGSGSASPSESFWDGTGCGLPAAHSITRCSRTSSLESPSLLMSCSSSTSGSPRTLMLPSSLPFTSADTGFDNNNPMDPFMYQTAVAAVAAAAAATPFVPKISHDERCVICGGTGLDNTTAFVCSRRSCQRLFCVNCVSLSTTAPGASIFNQHVNECIVCVYQSKRRPLTDASQWHFDFRDESDALFVRILRDMLPYGNGLFIEVSKTRQPCWRRKLRSGARKHFSFRFYGGIFESRLEALEISKGGSHAPLEQRPEQNSAGTNLSPEPLLSPCPINTTSNMNMRRNEELNCSALRFAAPASSFMPQSYNFLRPRNFDNGFSLAQGVPFSEGQYGDNPLGLVGYSAEPSNEMLPHQQQRGIEAAGATQPYDFDLLFKPHEDFCMSSVTSPYHQQHHSQNDMLMMNDLHENCSFYES